MREHPPLLKSRTSSSRTWPSVRSSTDSTMREGYPWLPLCNHFVRGWSNNDLPGSCGIQGIPQSKWLCFGLNLNSGPDSFSNLLEDTHLKRFCDFQCNGQSVRHRLVEAAGVLLAAQRNVERVAVDDGDDAFSFEDAVLHGSPPGRVGIDFRTAYTQFVLRKAAPQIRSPVASMTRVCRGQPCKRDCQATSDPAGGQCRRERQVKHVPLVRLDGRPSQCRNSLVRAEQCSLGNHLAVTEKPSLQTVHFSPRPLAVVAFVDHVAEHSFENLSCRSPRCTMNEQALHEHGQFGFIQTVASDFTAQFGETFNDLCSASLAKAVALLVPRVWTVRAGSRAAVPGAATR